MVPFTKELSLAPAVHGPIIFLVRNKELRVTRTCEFIIRQCDILIVWFSCTTWWSLPPPCKEINIYHIQYLPLPFPIWRKMISWKLFRVYYYAYNTFLNNTIIFHVKRRKDLCSAPPRNATVIPLNLRQLITRQQIGSRGFKWQQISHLYAAPGNSLKPTEMILYGITEVARNIDVCKG